MHQTLETIHSLRSIHGHFSDRPIEDDHVHTILKACVRAANASARQSYAIIVVDNAIKRQLSWPGARVLLFCVDFTRLVETARRLQQRFDAGFLMQFVTGAVDASLAAQTAVIAARALGIDSLITNRVYHEDLAKVYQLLGLPERYCLPLLAVCLGHPAHEPDYLKGRLDGLGVVHWGKYHRLSDTELDHVIADYDDPTRHLGMIENWRSQGFAHYLEWFFAKWSAGVGTREMGQPLVAALKAQGFLDDLLSSAAKPR